MPILDQNQGVVSIFIRTAPTTKTLNYTPNLKYQLEVVKLKVWPGCGDRYMYGRLGLRL